jgi:hypothetical protein
MCKLGTILNLVKLTETRNICTRKPCESFTETRNVQFATKSFISTAISLVLAYGFHSESRCSSKAHCSQADDQVNELLSKYTLNPAPSTEAQAIDIALRLERHVKQ